MIFGADNVIEVPGFVSITIDFHQFVAHHSVEFDNELIHTCKPGWKQNKLNRSSTPDKAIRSAVFQATILLPHLLFHHPPKLLWHAPGQSKRSSFLNEILSR